MKHRPHVVILGAGATMAAIPNGDKRGKKCSVMYNFLGNMGLVDIENTIKTIIPDAPIDNLESLYSYLAKEKKYDKVRSTLEEAIYKIMSEFDIPEELTIYDFLILSLRGKDCIATFNWDPLLVQAYNRSTKYTDNLPRLLFLHGNVAISYCDACGRYSPNLVKKCPQCKNQLQKSPLLYPIEEKSYSDNSFINGQWNTLLSYIEDAGMLTIFGYSGPKSDAKAMELMYTAFNNTGQRLNQIEIIDVKNEKEIRETWNEFVKPTNFSYHICSSFYDSFIAEYPRRSIEGYVKRNIEGCWSSSSAYLKDNDSHHNESVLMELIVQEK